MNRGWWAIAVVLTLAAVPPLQARSLTVTASAYNSKAAQTDATPRVGACNQPVEPGTNLLAVSPDLMKRGLRCGTKVQVEGVGDFVVWDRMADRWTRRIDIHLGRQVEKAEQWGERTVRIHW